ncbi:MAG: oxidoreductase [Legionellales bacterium]|nr:oxidoreductase [Legionellales bacterium]|tara:strand:- start:11047 stop:12108 length:1062 start_codon:yes stop_codon:yes gene_type:complete
MNKAPTIITDRKIRIALVGCGRIAKNHLASIAKYPDDFELVAVCDIDNTAVDTAATEYGVPGFTALSEMLDKINCDVVSICTPSGVHPKQAIQIANHGRHVITEKPMATHWQDGLDMVDACEQNDVRLFVVKQNRRNATLQLLKKAVEAKRFGKIYMINLNVFWTRPQSYYDQASWRGTWEFDGGAFMNQASHYVDLLHWLGGPIESINAMTGTLARNIEAEDTGVVNIRWRDGALGSMAVTMLTYPKNLEGSITILGEKGTARIGGVAVNEIQEWSFEEELPEDKDIQAANYETTSVYGFGHPLYYKNVIDVLRGEAEPETDGREGLKSLETLVAIYKSARDKQTVALPLEF